MEGKSIEDIILERYANEITTDAALSKRLERSPYQLPLVHSNILASYRVSSTCNSNRSQKSRLNKTASDRSRSTELGRVPPHTPKDSEVSLSQATFPGRRRHGSTNGDETHESGGIDVELNLDHSQDLRSLKDESGRASQSSKGRKKVKQKKSTYLLTPEVYVVNAFRNGDTSTSYRISASSFERLLEECTQRMNLPSSARKLFLSTGKELTKDVLLPRGTNVFISTGEPFKDPLRMFEKKLSIKADMQWTLNGVNLPSNRERETTKPVITSTRLEGNKAAKKRILVFQNGKGLKGIEVTADMTNTEDFIQSCTVKLKSGQQFKRILLMDGQEVSNLHTIPEVHHLLNTTGAPLLGPVWLSKGESLSPIGVEEFTREAIDSVKKMKTQSEKYLAQLNSAYYCDDKSSLAGDPQLTDKRILSMSTRELERKISVESEKLDEFTAFLAQYKGKLREIEPKAKCELEEGSQFTMKHITALPENHRLVSDRRGIRLRVYQNGRDSDQTIVHFNVREGSRGLNKDKEKTKIVFQRFMDSLSTNPQLASQNNKSKGILVQRLFTKSGKEITDVLNLQYDDEIWISHGENWIDPFTYCLQAEINQVIVWKKGSATHVVRSDIPPIDEAMERPSAWEAQSQLPDGIEHMKLELNDSGDEQDTDDSEEAARTSSSKPPEGSVSSNSCFLQNCRNRRLCLFIEPVVGIVRVPRESSVIAKGEEQSRPILPVWPRAGIAQVWVIHKSGQISVKGFPHLALAVSDCDIQMQLSGVEIRGSLVQFFPFERDEFRVPASQQWIFHTDGLVYSNKFPSLALTYLGGSIDELSSCPKNELDNNPGSQLGYRNMLAVCQPLDAKLAKYQRFGIRQHKLGNLGQLRKAAKFRDPAWSKMAIVWPTDPKGNWIDDFDWPIEGQMLTFAPPIKYKHDVEQPKRLFCLKNGERKEEVGVFITAPDMTNMRKDRQLLKRHVTKSRRLIAGSETDLASDAASGVSSSSTDADQKVSDVEFQIFLESCTAKLGFAAEAKRLFDRNGAEHKSLKHLERDQIVYISTGEDWIDPKYTKSQLEARSLIAKLSDDVEKIRYFVTLKRSVDSLVLSAQSLTVGAKIGVARVAYAGEVQQGDTSGLGGGGIGWMRQSHQDGDEKLNKLHWPWERIVSNDLDDHRSSRKRLDSRGGDDDLLRQFGYEDGFIYAKEDPSLVVTASDANGKVAMEVTLQRRRPDNVYQRWQLAGNGFILLRYQANSALTVQMPRTVASDVDTESSVLTAQPQVAHQFGRSNQLFMLDEARGIIRCFASNALDTAITVASHSGCCTCSVVVPKDYALDQPGYIAYLPVDGKLQESRRDEGKMKRCEVCVGCAKSLRGRYKLQKIGFTTRADFACAFGQSSALGLKETGAFRLLGGKLDLTDGEDMATLKTWERELEARRESLSLKAISERLSEAVTPRPIRVLAYRNGNGRQNPGVLIASSSVQGLMDQCTLKLVTDEPVSRIFLEDGTEVTEISGLRRWREANASLVRKRLREFERSDDVKDVETVDSRVSGEASATEDNLEPRLTSKYFVIGSRFAAPSAYNLGISLFSMSFLEEILQQQDDEKEDSRRLAVRYSIFGQTLTTDPFAGEDTFEGEKREILVKSELQILRRYFRDKFRLLRLDLIDLKQESVLATCYVPLDSLIREEHEEFINSSKMAADYAWYRKSASKPKGERTHASMHVEVSITVSIDVEVSDNEDDDIVHEKDGAANSESDKEDSLDDATVEVWASTGEDFLAAMAGVSKPRVRLPHEAAETPQLLRLRVYHNGEDPKSSTVTVWAETVQQALENATTRLGLRKPARILYDRDGREVRDPLPRGNTRDDSTTAAALFCVSCGEAFQPTQPPPTQPSTSSHQSAASVAPPPVFDTKRVLVAESTRVSGVIVWGDSLEALLKTATTRLKLRAPAVCFFHRGNGRKVVSFAEVSRDAQLLVSTNGKPPNQPLSVATSATAPPSQK